MSVVSLQRNEQFTALAIIAMVSLSISFTDWAQRAAPLSLPIVFSSICAIIFMYWLPMVLGYVLIQRIKIAHWMSQFVTLYLSMVAGGWIFGALRAHLLGIPAFMLSDAMIIALPWSSAILLLVKFYLTRKRLKDEQMLRQQAEIKVLHSQLNPHFLFNSLNTIAALVQSSPGQAETLVHNLSAILRYSLKHAISDHQSSGVVALSDELLMLHQWCEIEQCRFGNNLQVAFDIDEALLSAPLPAMVLQPLIENAIKHGKRRPLCVTIHAYTDAGHPTIAVSDNGVGFPPDILLGGAKPGLGLAITRSRLELEANTKLTLSNQPNGGARAQFVLRELPC
ncbi:sensor histidine kinase [Pseudoalteromonas rubra]|uniref:Sensor histidine kinase n=1 Tax=Pseudoalteromonas rubra TaxID=43658 RepID=A0A5S3X709_9GAMM|nr:histidine kinase [Pseudoalteromonas rubra]TMP39745.1 sensor histidine kinase [Pseudoalteromonas rubra]